MKVRKVFLGLVLLVTLSIGGCVAGFSLLAIAQPNEFDLPEPSGSFAVGRLFVDWTDPTRIDPLAPAEDVARKLPIWIWYPANIASDAAPLPYLPESVLGALEEAAVPQLRNTLGLLSTNQRNVSSHSLDAPRAAEGTFPVILLRPLRGGLAPQYAVLAEDLASHGYFVVGVDIPFTTRVAVYSDGSVARRTNAGAPPEFDVGNTNPLAPGIPNDLFLPVLDVLVDDGSFVLDRLEEMNSGEGSFQGRLDLGAVGAVGHSVGGTAALQFCASDRRCRAGINIDGYVMGSVVETGIDTPFLFIWSDRPIWRKAVTELDASERAVMSAVNRIRAGLPNEVQWLVLKDSGHISFTDSALFTSPTLGRLTGTMGSIDAERGMLATRDYVRTFFDVYLKGLPDELLVELARRYPEAEID
jgi:predicted dienelactone hydrolase